MSRDSGLPGVTASRAGWAGWLWVWGPTVAWMLAIFTGTSIPDVGGATPTGGDKVLHFLVYAGLAVLMHRSWRLKRAGAGSQSGWAKATVLTAGGWAIFDELHQLAIPGRDFELLDLAADAAGILVGLLLVTYGQVRRRRSAPEVK